MDEFIMGKKVVSPGQLISGANVIGNLVYTAGMTGGQGDTETQIRNTFQRLKDVLENSGTSMDNVLKATVFLADLSDRSKYLNGIWKEYFPHNPPSRTCIQVGLSDGIKIEIEMIAFIPEK